MKLIYVLLVAGLVLQACGSSSGGGSGGNTPPSNGPPSENPGQPAHPEGEIFFNGVDKSVAAGASGDLYTSERFYILSSRLSVYALLCDFKNELGYSKEFSVLWNGSTALQSLAEKSYGGQTPAYNRFEKQRNVDSNRLSFQSGPNACDVSRQTFIDYVAMTPAAFENIVRTTPRGAL